MSAMIEVQVTDVRQLTPVVREFSFRAIDGTLPGFSCGSHVQVILPTEGRTLRNAYSLLGDPRDTGAYRIAVRLQEASRGGSRYLHEQVRVGDRLQIGAPRNLFALHSQARHHILVAGGIGITPFMAYLAELGAQGASFELHYAYRSGLTDAYAGELRERLGERFHGYDAAAGQRLDCTSLFAGKPLGSHLYVCGPQRLLDELKTLAGAHGWSDGRLHWEACRTRAGPALHRRVGAQWPASAGAGRPQPARSAGGGRCRGAQPVPGRGMRAMHHALPERRGGAPRSLPG